MTFQLRMTSATTKCSKMTSSIWKRLLARQPSLFSTILKVDVKKICPRNVVVEFKKREILASLRRQRVVLDASQSLQIIKEPRVIFRGKQVQAAMTALALWISSCSQFNAWQNTFEVVK